MQSKCKVIAVANQKGGVGTIILKGYSSTVQNAVAIFRNLAAIRRIRSRTAEWTLILLDVVLGIVFNNRGLLGLLPLAANLEYSAAVFRFRDQEHKLKYAFILNMLMHAVFSFAIMNYVGAVSNIIVAVTAAVSLIRERRQAAVETKEIRT